MGTESVGRDLASLCERVKTRECSATTRLLNALRRFDTRGAHAHFELVTHWNELHHAVTCAVAARAEACEPTFATESWFLEELFVHLTPKPDEDAAYVTGVKVGSMRVLSRICTFELDQQSPVSAEGNPRSCADSLITILERGNEMHAVAHCHPGSGKSATRESEKDIRYLARIQKAGSEAIGMIFSRDGHVRFFTVEKPCQVEIYGEGVVHVEDNVYKITTPEADRH